MSKIQFKNNHWHWLILMGILILGFIAGGYYYDRQQVQLVRHAEYQEMTAVSRLKINQVSAWRKEAIFNVKVYAQSSLFSEAVVKLLKHTENILLKNKILEGWELIRINDGFSNVMLAGLDGRVKLSLEPVKIGLTLHEKELIQKTAKTGKIIFSDLFRDLAGGAVRIAVMAPVLDSSRQPVAVLILQINPETDLYPLLDFWPTSNENSGTYLIRREDDKFMLLSNLKIDSTKGLIKILPLNLNMIKAINKGIDSGGIFEGRDSRGIEVAGYISRIPDTTWLMVSHVDKDKILAKARFHSHYIAIIVCSLILVAILGLGFIYRHQHAILYKKMYKAEKTRNEYLEEFRITLYSIGDGVISMDKTGCIRHMNPVAERLTGWNEAEAKDRPLQDLFHIIHEKTRQRIETPDRLVLQKNGVVKLPADTLLIARDGTEYPITDSAAPINKEKDKLMGIVVVFSDATAERKAQRDLLISKELYRDFFMEDISGDFISLPDGTLLDYNRAFVGMFGLDTKDETEKYNFFKFCPADKSKDRFLELLCKQKTICNYEQELLRMDGKPVQVIMNVTGKFDSDGNLIQFQGYIVNISERKKLEKQFLQAQKMEAVGRLAGGVAHDFNNMLSIILGYSGMLLSKDEKLDKDDYEDLLQIKNAAERSADLTRQLLAFARKQIVEPVELNLNDTVESMLKMLGRLIGEEIDLVWEPHTDIWKVKMDPSQIDQILANLLVNTRDAIAGVGKVTIETDNTVFDQSYCDDHLGFIPGEYVMLSVSDDGSGMDEDTVSKIFEPFFTTKEKGKGTGLGLATVYGIIKQNKGFINVYSEPGRGTKFSIYMPRFIDIKKTTPHKELKPDVVKGGTETILLVEDEKQILDITRRILEVLGYTVLSAGTPGEAIHIAERYAGHIDLLITDVVLPEMTGRDLVEKFLVARPEMKSLYMSGYTANAIAHQGVLEEGVYFLQKPFSRKQLVGKIREVLYS